VYVYCKTFHYHHGKNDRTAEHVLYCLLVAVVVPALPAISADTGLNGWVEGLGTIARESQAYRPFVIHITAAISTAVPITFVTVTTSIPITIRSITVFVPATVTLTVSIAVSPVRVTVATRIGAAGCFVIDPARSQEGQPAS